MNAAVKRVERSVAVLTAISHYPQARPHARGYGATVLIYKKSIYLLLESRKDYHDYCSYSMHLYLSDNTPMNTQEAKDILDYALFRNVYNMIYPEDRCLITFEGDNYVLAEHDTGKLHHFRVTIEPHEWDSTQALKDQEWEFE